MENLEIHPAIVEKLKTKHRVTVEEIHECFSNVTRGFLVDTREHNQTDPPTRWFIEETNMGRKLLVAFMHFPKSNKIIVKSAYEPDQSQLSNYKKLTQV